MKKLLFIIASLFLFTTVVLAAPAPITGTFATCVGSISVLSDATPGGTWSSSSTSVAVVNASTGLVSGISAGTVNITYTVGTSYVTAVFAVRALPVLTPDSIKGCVGRIYPLHSSQYAGTWVSSNPAIAAVNYVGAVSCVAPGNATITYTSSGGCIATASVTVNALPLPVTGGSFVYSGFTTTLADLTPGGVWSTSDPSLAIVASTGIVTGVSAGLVNISYTIPSTGCVSIRRVNVDPLPGTNNLYAWFPFCGDTQDHSGNGRDLLNFISGTPATLTADRFGNANNAYNFSGGNCFMQYSTFYPNPGVPPDFTWSCWINPTVPQSSIILFNGDPNLNGYGLIMNDGTAFPGGPGTSVSFLVPGFGQTAPIDLSSALYAPYNRWHNLVVVKSGGFYNFYVDNNFPGVFLIATFTPPSIGSFFAVGGNATGGALGPRSFIGDIDDIAYITKQLNGAERTSIFNFNPDAKKFTLGNDTTICSDFLTTVPNPQTPGGAYTWKTFVIGSGYVTTDTLDTIITHYPTSGPFGNTYSLTITKPYGCTAADTFTVYKSPIAVSLGADRNFCVGDTITLSNYFPGSSFLWSTGDTSHSLSLTNTGTYYLEVDSIVRFTNSAGLPDSSLCVGRDTINLHAYDIPILSIPHSVINCQGNPDTVYTHADPGYNYLWSTGLTGDSAILVATGTYWVRVANGGCVRSDTIRAVIINQAVTLKSTDTAICQGEQAHAYATANPAVTYQWTPTAGITTPYLADFLFTPDTSAEYYLRVSFPGCPDLLDSFFVDVQPRPIVNIGGNRDVCEGDTIHITAITKPGWYLHNMYSWSPLNPRLDIRDSSTVVYTAYNLHDSERLIVKAFAPVYLTGHLSCYSMDSAEIFVHPKFYDSMARQIDLCPGDSIQLIPYFNKYTIDTLGTVNIASNVWSPSTYLDNPNVRAPWVHPITTTDYRLIATSEFGCADTMFTRIVMHPAAIINLGDSVSIAPGESYHILPQTNCTKFSWFPPLGLNDTNASDPVATPNANTSYVVNAYTSDGCFVKDSIKIRLDVGHSIDIPNAFTPNSIYNNKFSIIKHGLVAFNYFRIFDRWGVLVYESKDIDKGWDGTFNDKPQPSGVYVYDIEAVTTTGVVFHRQGNVTLIR